MKIFPDFTTFAENVGKRNSNPKYVTHSLELVFTVFIFIGIGFLIDSALNTSPTFLIFFLAFGSIGALVSAYYRFKHLANEMEKGKVWNRETNYKKIESIEETDYIEVPKGYGEENGT